MNIELKPIAESKVRQLGGDVCGVLVRKDGRLAAVYEHGRVQWLQDGQGAEPVNWGPKPSKPGRYVVRGFDSAGTEALVCVAEDGGELVCNLHDSNSDPLERYSNLMSEISDRFEWVELHSHHQPAQKVCDERQANAVLTDRVEELEAMVKVFLGCIETGLMPESMSPCYQKVISLVGRNADDEKERNGD